MKCGVAMFYSSRRKHLEIIGKTVKSDEVRTGHFIWIQAGRVFLWNEDMVWIGGCRCIKHNIFNEGRIKPRMNLGLPFP